MLGTITMAPRVVRRRPAAWHTPNLFIGNLDDVAYRTDGSLVKLVNEIWARHSHKLTHGPRAPVITSTRSRQIPAKRFGFIEFKNIGDAMQTYDWIKQYRIRDIRPILAGTPSCAGVQLRT